MLTQFILFPLEAVSLIPLHPHSPPPPHPLSCGGCVSHSSPSSLTSSSSLWRLCLSFLSILSHFILFLWRLSLSFLSILTHLLLHILFPVEAVSHIPLHPHSLHPLPSGGCVSHSSPSSLTSSSTSSSLWRLCLSFLSILTHPLFLILTPMDAEPLISIHPHSPPPPHPPPYGG
jgi:hypothetical protein